MTRTFTLGLLGAALLPSFAFAQGGVGAPTDVTISPFIFQTIASRNPDFDRSTYLYPTGDLAGQTNPNVGDIRLDGVSINGVTYTAEQPHLVTTATIVIDDAVDVERGGNNLASGYGIGADLDTWAEQGIGTTTPTTDDVVLAHANLNLSSITPVREGVGTTIYEVSFDTPTDTLLIWERGGSGDVLVSALDDDGGVLGSYKVRDGANDAGALSDYARTGIIVTTYVQDGFLNQGQALSSVGLQLSTPVSTFRLTVYQEAEGEGATRYNGPDLKILALAAE